MLRTIPLIVCLACAAFEAMVDAQNAAPVFKSSVTVVPISAVVRDHRGRTITTLKASDFEVRDNGEPRPILAFQTDESTALTIALLVDTSGSMRLESKLAAAREVVTEIATELRDGIDAVGLFTFDAALHEVHEFTRHPASLDSALTDAAPFGATSLYDSIAETARRLEALPSVRRAIVVLTDGVDTSSALTPTEVSARASAIDVPVYVVATVPRIDQANYVERAASPTARSTADARDLALWTGGDLLWASNAWGAASAARQILAELRHQYFIAVDSARDSAWRRLDVRVRDRRLTVRARSGYFGRDSRPVR
jgi:Ca-activated chloride channel homolog